MSAFWVSEEAIFYPVQGGFYLVNARRASERVLYEALRSGRARPLLLAPRAPWPKGLEERLPLLKMLGITLVRSNGWATPKTWPDVPWSPRAHQLREALSQIAELPPLALEDALKVLSRSFPYPPDAEPEPLITALLACDEPHEGPFGGLTMAFYSWEELLKGL